MKSDERMAMGFLAALVILALGSLVAIGFAFRWAA